MNTLGLRKEGLDISLLFYNTMVRVDDLYLNSEDYQVDLHRYEPLPTTQSTADNSRKQRSLLEEIEESDKEPDRERPGFDKQVMMLRRLELPRENRLEWSLRDYFLKACYSAIYWRAITVQHEG